MRYWYVDEYMAWQDQRTGWVPYCVRKRENQGIGAMKSTGVDTMGPLGSD